MLNAKVQKDGNLLLTAGNEARAYLKSKRANYCDDALLADGLEQYRCNGSFTPFSAEDANPFVGLTSAPCIAEDMTTHDDGKNEIIGRLWYFPNYMITSPVDELIKRGRVVFTLAE